MKSVRKPKKQGAETPGESLPEWTSVGQIPGFPFETFDQMQAAVAARSFNIGVDPYAAAEWTDHFATGSRKALITALSLLLLLSAIAPVAAAFMTGDYWLLAALPIQAVTFYFSHPASFARKWATVCGALTLPLFVNLLLNHMTTEATLAAYAGLTFATVRAAAFIANSTFRKALLGDEKLFLEAYAIRACTLRNSETQRVYAVKEGLTS